MRRQQHEVYPNAPLVLVAVEMRYPEQPVLDTQTTQRHLRDRLRAVLPLLENETRQQLEVSFGPAVGVPASRVQSQTVPRLATRDRRTHFTVTARSAVLETSKYDGYDVLRPLIGECAAALQGVGDLDGLVRIGMRYIDEIRVPGIGRVPSDWSGWVHGSLMAPADVGRAVGLEPRAWQGLAQFASGPDSAVTMRYGPGHGFAVAPQGPVRHEAADAGPFFLVDLDSFWEPLEVPEFSPEVVLEASDRLHAPIHDMFERVVTDRLRSDVLRGGSA
jgi:uncharacterized protein (TIGR04255 family)